MDDLFAPNIKRVELLKETFAPLKEITFTGMLRAENSDRKLTDAVYDLGVRYVHLGLESGSDKILKALKGGSATAEKNLQALINCHESGLNNSGTFIIGAPDEEIEDYDATYQFIKKSLESGILNNFTFTPLIPFPGTEIWEYGVRYDIIDPNNVRWRALNADIDNFEPEIYYYLSKKLTKKEFLYQVAKFKELYEWSKALPII